jgi:uncharacterized membrane protein YphA (DoxX/SURF4 family)
MKNKKLAYWSSTSLVSVMMLLSAFFYLSAAPQMVEAMAHLGYPVYFMKVLGVAKLLGAIAIVFPRFPRLTEWAYAGFSFTFIGAAFSHFSSGDGVGMMATPLVIFGILMVSYRFRSLEQKNLG